MLRNRLNAFVIASHPGSKPWRISLSYPFVYAIIVFAVVGVVTAAIGVHHYGRMLVKVNDYEDLLSNNDSLRSENYDYRNQTAQLGEKIDFLETTSRKLMIHSGLDSRDLGGVGGFSKETFSRPLPVSAGTLESIDTYNKRVNELEDRYQRINHDVSEKAFIAAAIPSILPVRGYLTGKMGLREDPFNSAITDYHSGVDFSARYGSRVIAPADGTVIFAGKRAGYGNIVVIDHKYGMVTRYGHLWKFDVHVGQRVTRNDLIGYVGTTGRTTGPHLHFELWVHNRAVNPMDFIRKSRDLN